MYFFDFEDGKRAELPGGIIRTVLAYSDNVMCTHWDIPAGKNEIPAHSHPHEQFSIVMKGSALYKIGDEEKLMKAGDSCVMPPNVPHSVTGVGEAVIAIDVFSPKRDDFLA